MMKTRYAKRTVVKAICACIALYGIILITFNSDTSSNTTGNAIVRNELLKERNKVDSKQFYFVKSNENQHADDFLLNLENVNILTEILGDDIKDGTMWYGIEEVNNENKQHAQEKQNHQKQSKNIDDVLSKEKLVEEKSIPVVKDARYQMIGNSVNNKFGMEGLKKFDGLVKNGHDPIAALKIIQGGGEVPEEFNNNKDHVTRINDEDSVFKEDLSNDAYDVGLRVLGNSNQESKSKKDPKIISAREYEQLQADVINQGVTRQPNMENLRIEVVRKSMNESGVVTMSKLLLTEQQFKKFMAEEFIKSFANPFPKSKVPPTLTPYNDSIPRPNPLSIIEDKTMALPLDEIRKELSLQNNRRMSFGDTDITQIPAVQEAIKKAGPTNIPNIAHFIWFRCHHVKIHHYLSWLSVYRNQKPDVILFHTNCTPEGSYWDNLRKTIGTKLHIVKRTPPVTVWGRPIEGVEHQSDVTRLHVLLEVGGIYLDDDVIILKHLERFMNESIVLGEENYDALANSIIMAQPTSWFLHKWYYEYRLFNDSKWSYSSCFVPWALWKIFPSKIQVVERRMLRPNWEEIKYIYHELWDWSENYSIHLYSRFMRAVDGTEERTVKELAVLNTTYGEIARYVLWGEKHVKDISDWI